MSSTLSSIDEGDVLNPRGGRIYSKKDDKDRSQGKGDGITIWTTLRERAIEEIITSSIQGQLERAGIWLKEENDDERSEIEDQINLLEERAPTVEAEWSDRLWKKFFFKVPKKEDILGRFLEKRQTHTLNLENSKLELTFDRSGASSSSLPQDTLNKSTENRYPPIMPNPSKKFRPSVPISANPYDVDPNRLKNGHAFSDISYAVIIPKDVSQKDSVLVKSLPTIRLYKDATHYLENMKIEVKPQKWSLGEKTYAVRYLTLTAMTMLHEYLKLCYLSVEADDFFAKPILPVIHLIAAVGHTASHYIHRIRPATEDPVRYESHWVADFDLKIARERNQFRNRINEIQVLHATIVKKAMQKKLEEVLLALGKLGTDKATHRIAERTHKRVQFSWAVCDHTLGFSINREIPNPPLSVFASQAFALEQSTKGGKRRRQATLESQQDEQRGNPAFILEQSTKDGKDRCQATLKRQPDKQCGNQARRGEPYCGTHLAKKK